jgi:hypothetical protein
VEHHKVSEQAREFAYIIQQLSREDRLILRNIMLAKLYRHRTWELKDLEFVFAHPRPQPHVIGQ